VPLKRRGCLHSPSHLGAGTTCLSHLNYLSLLERLVARQLLAYLNTSGLLPWLQSAYRPHHSTETAILKILSDILLAIDAGDLSALVLLDLSAAFDTVDHVINKQTHRFIVDMAARRLDQHKTQ